MFFVAIAGLGDFVALEFGDVTLVTPLGSLTLIANIFMANWFHGEKLCVPAAAFLFQDASIESAFAARC